MPSANPRLFVGGCPRSGTTLLQRMLNHHPQLAVANDTHFIPRVLEKSDSGQVDLIEQAMDGQPVPLNNELIANVWSYHRFYRLGLQRPDFDRVVNDSTTYQQLVTGLFNAFAERANKPYAGEKTPDYVRHAPLLLHLFPEAKFVNIFRDGRNVALSLLDWASPVPKGPSRIDFWRVDRIAVAALWWSEFVRDGQRYAAEFPKQFINVFYEQVVEQPRVNLEKLCRFAELEFDAAMLDYHVGKAKAGPNLSAKKRWLPPTGNLRDWQQSMNQEDADVFHYLAGDELTSLGYHVPNMTSNRAVVKRAAKAKAWWERNRPQEVVPA